MKNKSWRTITVLCLTVWAAYAVAPSVIYFSTPKDERNSKDFAEKHLPSWLPQKHVKLGLDLQGGVQLVLGVNTDTAIDNKLSRMGTEIQRWSDDESKGVAKAYNIENKQILRVEMQNEDVIPDFKSGMGEEFPGLVQVERDGTVIDLAYSDDQISRIKESAIEQAERVIRNRVDGWGVSEPVINRRVADNSILVQLPGFRDPEKAKELLGRTAQLRFHIVDDKFTGFADVIKGKLPDGITSTNHNQDALVSENRDQLMAFVKQAVKIPDDRRLYLQREDLAGGNKARFTTYVVEASSEVGGDDILDAFVTEDTSGLDRRPEVALRFTGPGGKRFADVTGANVNRRLGIVLDNELISAPNIQTKIAGGQARITLGSGGGYQEIYEEANDLALILKSGALPATIEVLEERQVGASLGPELADQGIKGALVGFGLVLIFMVFWYRKPGTIAVLAIALNGVYLLALMAGFGFALTLPGIAGFILTLGMAVDANVLINERIRQELKEGKNAKKSLENGFKKVFWTIIDANVTTLIAALVLLETNSSGPIRGFAITLMIGLLVSMFTSLYVSKLIFELSVVSKTDQAVRQWLGGDAAVSGRYFSFNFLRHGKTAAIVGVAITLAVLGFGSTRGVNWGVDFAGGTEMMVGFGQDVEPSQISDVAKTVGISALTMQALEGGKRQYLIRFGQQADKGDKGKAGSTNREAIRVQDFKSAITSQMSSSSPEILQVDYVGPQIGKELRTQGIVSVFYAMIGVLLYIALRFDMRFGPGAVLKMAQDVFVMFGFYVFFWRSFDLTSVAAFLTVVGYSVNDTIVIYDRIRENIVLHARRPLLDNINVSLNETLSRTINTSVTTVIALTGILIFGSGQIWNFAMAMAVGVVAATLSSQFLASSFVLWLENWKRQRRKSSGTGGAVAAAR